MNATFRPGAALRGTLVAPPDKSLSHRAALLGAMSDEPVLVTNYLDAADTRSSLDAVRALGALVDDARRRHASSAAPACARRRPARRSTSATPARCCACCRAGSPGSPTARWTLDGDASIRRRPVDRVAAPLARWAPSCARATTASRRCAIAGRRLHGIEYELPVASAQIKSCVLLAGLLAEGTTTVVEPEPSRDHTERLLARAGAGIERDGARVTVTCQDELELDAIHVPGDPSSAAFHVAAAVLVPGSRLVVEGMAANWTRVGFFRILERMGAVADRRPRGARERRARRRAAVRARRRPRPARRHARDRRRGAAGDRRAAARRAARLLRRGRDGRRGRAGAAR